MPYLKHEKVLYEITKEQAEKIISNIDNGKKIILGIEMFSPFNCEIIESLPHNRDEYEIKLIKRKKLSESVESWEKVNYEPNKISQEEQLRRNKIIEDVRKRLAQKLEWKRK